ncbi:hypothetical protein P7C73_g1555, partial [Tremellales sp. Uapishka_1]
MAPSYSPIALQHINLVVKRGTLDLAREFYADTVGFGIDKVPALQKDTLAWFRIGDGPQQIHIAFEGVPGHPDPSPLSSRHPCFMLPSVEALAELQRRIWAHHIAKSPAAALQCDQPGEENSGAKGVEYPTRFFARDYSGNRLEFTTPLH